ncbi:SGNH/GDSL hydrolase family protein [Candidatus Saccharibacteria bacterium]|nr:SGNH/GDSL hydrolase family protein [Candidatus Saccharibacteria bacterium]
MSITNELIGLYGEIPLQHIAEPRSDIDDKKADSLVEELRKLYGVDLPIIRIDETCIPANTNSHLLINSPHKYEPLLITGQAELGERVPVSLFLPGRAKQAIKYLGIAAGVSALVGISGGDRAHAHEAPEEDLDTPNGVVIGKNQTLYSELRKFYTHEEVEHELSKRNITLEQANSLKLTVGFAWEVHPDTVAERDARLGGNTSSFLLDSGEDIVKEFRDRGNTSIDDVKKTLQHNGWSNDVNNLLAGTNVNVPAGVILGPEHTQQVPVVLATPAAEIPVAPEPARAPLAEMPAPETTVLHLQGPNIITDLTNLDVTDPYQAGMEAVWISKIDPTKMQKGDAYTVLAKRLPAPPAGPLESEIKPEPEFITLPPGGSIISVLTSLGIPNPVLVANRIRAFNDNMTLEEARKILPGEPIAVPPGMLLHSHESPITEPVNIILPNVPIEAPTDSQSEVNSLISTPVPGIAIGDSLTKGMASLGDLDAKGAANGLEIDSSNAVSGRSLIEALKGPIDFDHLLSQKFVVLALGTNALESDAVYADTIRSWNGALKAEAAIRGVDMPAIFLVTLVEIEDGENRVPDETRNGVIHDLKDELGLHSIEWADYVAAHPEIYASGGFHPSDYGAMSDFVVNEIAHQLAPVMPDTPGEVVPTEESQSEVAHPAEVVAPAEPIVETTELPEAIVEPALVNILEELRAHYGEGSIDIAKLGAFVETHFAHPAPAQGISEEAVGHLYHLPERQEGFDYVTHPLTCINETLATAPLLAVIIAMQDYARLLTMYDDRFKQFYGFEYEIGDASSGHHNSHDNATAVDLRSRYDGVGPLINPQGPLFASGAPNFYAEFTAEIMQFGLNLTYNGDKLIDRIEITSKDIEKALTGNNKKGDDVSYQPGHADHIHLELEKRYGIKVNPNYKALSCADPSTGGTTATLYPVSPPAPVAIEEVIIEPVAEQVAEIVEEILEVVEPSIDIPQEEVKEPEVIPPTITEVIEHARQLTPEEYINIYNGGESWTVTYRDGSTAQASPEAQKWVDFVWRVKHGASPAVVQKALTVTGAESGFKNNIKNKKTQDSCLFQVNPVNKKFTESLGYDYDTLHLNPEACAEVAYALYEQSIGKDYDAETINYWINNYGLNLPENMYDLLTSGKAISEGFFPWLMSSSKTGLI